VIRILILLLLLLPSFSAADATPDALVGKLQNCYRSLDTMKAGFTQSYRSKRFSDAITEKGTVYFKKGGLMKWEYEQPAKKVFVSDNEYYWYYVPDDKQVIKAPVGATGKNSPTLFLAGRGDFGRDFRAEWADPRPGSHIVRLIPLVEQPDFKYLIVDVDPVKGLVLRLEVVDEYDNRIEYIFQQIKENPKLPADFFTFRPPPGTDILFQRQDEE
jgi:outer membrane lipoprotein carrier protein